MVVETYLGIIRKKGKRQRNRNLPVVGYGNVSSLFLWREPIASFKPLNCMLKLLLPICILIVNI